jgi:hypothetical protein
MIDEILQLLKLSDYYGCHEIIDVAKGQYKMPNTINESVKQKKRKAAWKKR